MNTTFAEHLLHLHQVSFEEGGILLLSANAALVSAALRNLGFGDHVMTSAEIAASIPTSSEMVSVFAGWAAVHWPKQTFNSILLDGLLDGLDGAHIAAALAAMKRISRHGLMIVTYMHPREVMETAGFSVGFRKCRGMSKAVTYEDLEADPLPRSIFLEPVPMAANDRFPLASLLATRDLHMDMLRETGRRSDGHLARYVEAASIVPDGGTVLDAACGFGYGSALIARLSASDKVIGLDLDEGCATYAIENFGCLDRRLEYRQGDVTNLDFLPDESVDVVASFETIEHIPDYAAFLEEVHRVLKPGGRIMASVPNLWVDETGRDPNPHHFHVFDWKRFRAVFPAPKWRIDGEANQTAGGGFKLPHAPRRITAVPSHSTAPDAETEWCLLAATKI